MEKIAELCAAEQKYIDKLELVAKCYKKLVHDAADPETESDVELHPFPGLMNQHRVIFKFFEDMLELHADFFEFWTHSTEDYLYPDRCGQLFYNCLTEDRYDIYLQHIVGNPLRHEAVQRDFTGFLELALEFCTDCDENTLLLTGFECFKFPLDHLHYYGRALEDIVGSVCGDILNPNIINAANRMRHFLKKVEESKRLTEISNYADHVYLPNLGTYRMTSEFTARDYKEGQQHKVALILFTKGLILAVTRKGLSLFKKDVTYVYDSNYSIDQIELDVPDNCFRLKDAHSKLTCYKIMEKKEFLKKDTKAMLEFIEGIGRLKRIQSVEVMKISEYNCDVGGQETVNLAVISRNNDRGEFSETNPSMQLVEAINSRVCDKFIAKRREEQMQVLCHRNKKLLYWKRCQEEENNLEQ